MIIFYIMSFCLKKYLIVFPRSNFVNCCFLKTIIRTSWNSCLGTWNTILEIMRIFYLNSKHSTYTRKRKLLYNYLCPYVHLSDIGGNWILLVPISDRGLIFLWRFLSTMSIYSGNILVVDPSVRLLKAYM